MIDERPPGRIFLSYRRTDAQHVAGRLFDRLEARFGSGNVFMDVDSIEPGMDYGEAIDRAVSSCDVLLAVIGTKWIDAVDEYDRRRLDDPDDLIVLEIATALQRDVRVIPVLVEGAMPPRRQDLPEGLAQLARRQAVRLDHATFNTAVSALVTVLERALGKIGQNAVEAPKPRTTDAEDTRSSDDLSNVRSSKQDWTADDLMLLRRDHRPSARRIVAVFDVLAKQPDVEIALSNLAAATGLSHGELRGAFAGLTYFCNHLRPGVQYNWPIIWRHGPSTRPGQSQETWYHMTSAVAHRWSKSYDA